MQLTLRYFASIREAIGTGNEAWVTQASDLAGLRDELITRGTPHAQALARDRVLRMAVDHVLCDEHTPLKPGSEVAFFPPVTGG